MMELKPKQVRVKNLYSAVTASDVAAVTGPPKVGKSGDVFSGVVESVGSEVNSFGTGNKVFGSKAPRTGAHNDTVIINEDRIIAKLPENVDSKDAAALVDGPLTAYAFLVKHAELESGQKILINGASGSVGSAAVQIAKHLGAEVTGVSSGKNLKLIKSLGADRVVDYKKENLEDLPEKYDVFFDAVTKSSYTVAKNILTPSGKYMATAPTFSILINFIRTRFTRQKAIMAATGLFWKQADLNEICKLIEANELDPIIDSTYRLSELDEAYKYVKKGRKVGSVLIDTSNNN